jgi:hypothetical protein
MVVSRLCQCATAIAYADVIAAFAEGKESMCVLLDLLCLGLHHWRSDGMVALCRFLVLSGRVWL